MTTRWPHVLVEEGPSLAGIGVGDAIAIAPDAAIEVTTCAWSATRLALCIGGLGLGSFARASSTTLGATAPGAAATVWRVGYDPPRLEQRSGRDPFARAEPSWRSAGDVVRTGPWTLRFVLDGTPLATVERFGPHTAVHATSLEGPFGDRVRSQWVLPGNGARDALIVEETLAGEVTWFAEPRRTGVTLERLQELASGQLDRELAAGISAQMTDRQPITWIGFDGVARAIDHSRSPLREQRRVDIYGSLTRDRAPTDSAELSAELGGTRAATPAEIGAVVRTLAADAWERERALIEECGVLAG